MVFRMLRLSYNGLRPAGPQFLHDTAMLNFGRQIAKVCGRTTRRELLRAGGLAAAGLSLADLLRLEARGQAEAKKAKSVILLWLWGGPSHLDTFDMKPKAPVDYRGPYAPVPTRVPGIQICEL